MHRTKRRILISQDRKGPRTEYDLRVSKESLLILNFLPWSKVTIRIIIITVETSLSIIIDCIFHSASIYFSIINLGSGFARGNHYQNKDTFEKLDPYNTKLLLSCLKQTLTLVLGPVTPTGAITPEEADGAKEAMSAEAAAVVETITEIAQLLDIHLMEK